MARKVQTKKASSQDLQALRKGDDGEYVLVKVDRKTADMLKHLSDGAGTSVLEVTRILTWLGLKAFGRKVKFEDKQKVMEVSLEDYKKLSSIDRL